MKSSLDVPNNESAKATGIGAHDELLLTLGAMERIMEDLIRVAALLAITVLSIQMGLFFNWALLSLMLKAMNRVKSGTTASTKPPPTPTNWA